MVKKEIQVVEKPGTNMNVLWSAMIKTLQYQQKQIDYLKEHLIQRGIIIDAITNE